MNEILFSNQVIIYLLSEGTLFFLLFIAFIISVKILIKWDFNSFSPTQFKLEKQAYLVSTITLFVFLIKFILLIYFVFTVDSLSVLVPGAMCGAGVITANEYGTVLLGLKLLLLALLIFWFYLHFYDTHTKEHLYFKHKSWVFLAIFVFVVFELFLDFQYFLNIDTHQPVSCCSALFGQLEGANPLPFGLNIPLLLTLFYLLYVLVILTLNLNYKVVYIVSNLLFLYIAYYAVVYFFGTYIYQLPTHKCPFCMLQPDYFYIGYFVWGFLFIGTFIGIGDVLSSLVIGIPNLKYQKITSYFLSLFVLLCTSYVAVYWLKNGVLL